MISVCPLIASSHRFKRPALVPGASKTVFVIFVGLNAAMLVSRDDVAAHGTDLNGNKVLDW